MILCNYEAFTAPYQARTARQKAGSGGNWYERDIINLVAMSKNPRSSTIDRETTRKPLRTSEISVLDRAVEVIGDKGDAMRWMGTPVRALNYATPVSLLATSKGRESILTILGRLEHGAL